MLIDEKQYKKNILYLYNKTRQHQIELIIQMSKLKLIFLLHQVTFGWFVEKFKDFQLLL